VPRRNFSAHFDSDEHFKVACTLTGNSLGSSAGASVAGVEHTRAVLRAMRDHARSQLRSLRAPAQGEGGGAHLQGRRVSVAEGQWLGHSGTAGGRESDLFQLYRGNVWVNSAAVAWSSGHSERVEQIVCMFRS
jgi:hypothetical protein